MEKSSTVTQLVKTILKAFDEVEINKLAYASGFIKRSRKLTPLTFLALCIFHSDDIYTGSLSVICDTLRNDYNVDISENGLNERFTEKAVEFLNLFFTKLMNKQYGLTRKIACSTFDKIRIADATSFQVSSSYSNVYPWAGLKTKACQKEAFASVRIQFEYDLLTGEFLHINLDKEIYSDPLFLNIITPETRKNELVIRDLGYYKLANLQEISERKAYFISKLKSTSSVYSRNFMIDKERGKLKPYRDEEYQRVHLQEIIDKLKPGEILELPDVIIGVKDKLPCRLILTKLTAEDKGVRDKKLQQDFQRKNLKKTDATMLFSNITAYITNIPPDLLLSEEIHDHYSLRWQIELMFKSWKSVFNIDKNKEVKIDRFNCGLYGSIIGILLSTLIVNATKSDCYFEENIVLSEYKSFKLIKKSFGDIGLSILGGIRKIKATIKALYRTLKRKCKKSKRKKQKLPETILKTTKTNKDSLAEKVS